MSYKRAAFDKEWWEEVSGYLENNPDVGFEPDDVKGFIKFCVNRKMRGKTEAEQINEELELMKEKLEQQLERFEKEE